MDRFSEIEAFATVVDQGGFTDAARKLGISKSAVSKHVSALETRLGVKLLERTTRRVGLTEVGMAYHERALRILSETQEADTIATAMLAPPAGILRISAATDFGVHHLSPILGDFLGEHEDLKLSMALANRRVDLASEGFDMAIRVGETEDSSLRSRRFAESARHLVAAPSYFQANGRPGRIDDLNEHHLLHYAAQNSGAGWLLTAPSGEKRQVRTTSRLAINDGQSLLNAALSGIGIALLPSYLCAPALREGRLESAIPGLPAEVQGIYAVYPGGRFVQPKVRAFAEFLTRAFRGRGAEDW